MSVGATPPNVLCSASRFTSKWPGCGASSSLAPATNVGGSKNGEVPFSNCRRRYCGSAPLNTLTSLAAPITIGPQPLPASAFMCWKSIARPSPVPAWLNVFSSRLIEFAGFGLGVGGEPAGYALVTSTWV